MSKTLHEFENLHKRSDLPDFKSGDQIRVYVKVVEGSNERIQPFEGSVIRVRGNGLGRTYTVRKISYGIGVERTFPLHSPRVEKIEVIRSGKVRRSRLYYLRGLIGKASRIEQTKDSQ
ncbi:MAG: 50S ribosomal protein L19 [Elusimicrobia bacterium]|nr:50S ribosomal protein L19 [Elusimicrobiota bacterium]MBD3412665.1 50S ribosomal protein L19 [Elusimicrobiota bacterium]